MGTDQGQLELRRAKPMKIAYVINVDFAMRHFLLPLMRGARERGHEVIGICADGPMLAVVRAEGFKIITVPMVRRLSPAQQWRAFRALVRVLRIEQPDLLHAHMPISGLLGRLAARVAGIKRVAYTCHGFLFNQPGPRARRVASFVLEWLGARLTDDFFTVSREEAADARRLHISSNAIALGNGRDPCRFHPDADVRARVRAEFRVDDARPIVIAVSRLVRHKGYPELLVAMRDVDADLWVVGERLASDHGEDLGAIFAASGLGPRLTMLGYRDDIPDLLAAADIFALPSHFEGLPMSIIEAMLTGLPVVATDIRGPREQVVNGQTGFLVPPANVASLAAALQTLASDPDLRTRMGHEGRLYAAQHFDEGRVVARTLDLLRL